MSAYTDREKTVTFWTVIFYAPFVYACYGLWFLDIVGHLIPATWLFGFFMLFLLGRQCVFPQPSLLHFGMFALGLITFVLVQIKVYEEWYNFLIAFWVYSAANWYLHLLVLAKERNCSALRSLIQWGVTGLLLFNLYMFFSGSSEEMLTFLVVTGIALFAAVRYKRSA